MNWQSLREQLAGVVAGAALLGAGSTIIGNKVEIGKIDVRLTQLEQLGGKIDGLSTELQKTREELIRADAGARPRR